jgi:phospholipid/cholesterol/gamma-HCH transport system substrate-binding protein
METRAPFVIVGAFVLAAIAAAFGFVYWLHNSAGIGARTAYQVQFDGPVPGLLVGAGVLFNGIRVGEVTELRLATDNPRRVNATIAVSSGTPVRADTKVGLDFQGLTGVPVVALEGGTETADTGKVPILIAEPGAGQSMTQAARDALRRVDSILAENAEPLQGMIANFKVFSDGLARNTGKLDSIVAGLERMTGGGPQAAPKTIYSLRAPAVPASPGKPLKGQIVIPEPSAMTMLQTQRFLFTPANDSAEFANAQWADSLPRLLQAKLIQSFEDYDIAHAPLRSAEGVDVDYQLLIDVRDFQVAGGGAEIAFSARILDKQGKLVASKLFRATQPVGKVDPPSVVAAFDGAFAAVARELITWTVQSL